MIYTSKIEKAIRFATQVHQVNQDQRRKISHVPYIIHPLAVGIILARVGADEETVIAGILHDTVEDADKKHKITREDIANEFGNNVAQMVDDLTEPGEEKDWVQQKNLAIEKVIKASHTTQLIKAADMIHNITDYIEEYSISDNEIFTQYFIEVPKEARIITYKKRLQALENSWKDNPLLVELKEKIVILEKLWS